MIDAKTDQKYVAIFIAQLKSKEKNSRGGFLRVFCSFEAKQSIKYSSSTTNFSIFVEILCEIIQIGEFQQHRKSKNHTQIPIFLV